MTVQYLLLRLARTLLLTGALVATAVVAQTTVEIIPLNYRSSEQVIPVIQPLLGRDSSVSGFQNQLVIRATLTELAEIRRVLASIDKAPRRLLITVRQDADLERDRREAELSGSIGNDNARVTIPGSGSRSGGNVVLREGDNRLRARIIDSRQVSSDSSTQTLQVLEGASAFIRVGESRPVPTRQVVRTVINGQIVDRVVEGTQYRDAATGFSVRPRLQGEIVTLDINPQRDSFDDRHRGTVNVQQVTTTVSGRIGEWIDLGGIGDARSDERTALLGRSSGRIEDRRSVQVRVEVLP